MLAFIQAQGTFVMSILARLLEVMAKAMVCLVTALFVGLIGGIASIIAQYNCNNDTNDEDILKVLFHN